MSATPAAHPAVRRPCVRLRLGEEVVDVGRRPLVMGILNRTVDSFFDRGAHFALDAFLAQAERLVAGGADLLDVGARAAGVGTRDVAEAEETDLVAESVEALRSRFDVPISVDTWRASVAAAAFAAGAVVGNDLSGFSDPAYLPAAAAAGATVVATHMRLAPQVPDPDPVYGDVVEDVAAALAALVVRARAAGLADDQIAVDPGLDLGKTWRQSVQLLAAVSRFVEIGPAVLLAPSNKIFLGRLLGLERHERGDATVAACTAALLQGARIIRVHDARAGRQAADLVAALLDGA
jgi:dihydropteroate synthase